jgi:hypothetical protein
MVLLWTLSLATLTTNVPRKLPPSQVPKQVATVQVSEVVWIACRVGLDKDLASLFEYGL